MASNTKNTNKNKNSEICTESYRYELNYAQIEKIDCGKYTTSSIFTIGDHEWSITCYPRGNKENEQGAYLSLFLDLRSELSKDVSVIFDFNLLYKDGQPSAVQLTRTTHVYEKPGYGWGWPQYVKFENLKGLYVNVDDSLVVICTITILGATFCHVEVPPSDLNAHFGNLLEDKETSDIRLDVDGEIVHAHKLVLAARSPVFKAELYGPMNKNNSESVMIYDMEPIIFRVLLHFMYTDSLNFMHLDSSPIENKNDDSDMVDSVAMAQHLLVAADRYALDRLKLICESKLCKNITVGTLATTLVLAEQHNCPRLKDICISFVSEPENYRKITQTDGFEHLKLICPLILEEIEGKIDHTIAQLDELISECK